MNEIQWAKAVQEVVSKFFGEKHTSLEMLQGANLPYANEFLDYTELEEPNEMKPISYETDLLVIEKRSSAKTWTPRIVIECKVDSVTTHDAITYSEKAFVHKRVHPYLRYGILLGNRKHYPLPGRLFRHGLYFDFMASWTAYTPTSEELNLLLELLIDEVEASRNLEEMLYQSRSATRNRYIVLHRPLRLTPSSLTSTDSED